jgi:DNA-binding transcriptional ArsR family regulator
MIEDFFNSCNLHVETEESNEREVGCFMSVPLYQAKAEFFKTLGHPARIRILELLSERDHAVHELLEKIAIEPSNLSQQLAVLRRTSMVVSRRRAGEVVYSVSVPEVRDLLIAARSILSGILAAQGDLESELTPAASL